MNFCPKCRKKLVVQDFCVECGADLSEYLNNCTSDSLGGFDFSAMQNEANKQLSEQIGLQVENGVLVKYTGKTREVVIPKGVTEIFDGAFENNEIISSVVIPEGVKIIGKRAFYGCRYLKTVKIPSTVEEIYNEAFNGCAELEEVIIPEKVKIIRRSVFAGCHRLKSITIPKGLTRIEDYGLSCTSERVCISDLESWLKLEIDSYYGGGKPRGDLYVNGKLLEEAIIPTSVTVIKKEAFLGCKSLKSVILHNGISGIGENAFYNCKSLKAISVPGSVKGISKNAFYGCSTLSSVALNEGIEVIGADAFYGCVTESIRLPRSIRGLNGVFHPFGNRLKKVYAPKENRQYFKNIFGGIEIIEY